MITKTISLDLSIGKDEDGSFRTVEAGELTWFWGSYDRLPEYMLYKYLGNYFYLNCLTVPVAPEFVYLCRNGI